VQEGERPPDGGIRQLGNPARDDDGIHRALLPMVVEGWAGLGGASWLAGAVSRAAATGTEVTLPGPGRSYNDRQAGFSRHVRNGPAARIRNVPVGSVK
jgi:hypothetical protein